MNSWYLAYCRPREEGRAYQHLKNQGVESYYPMVEVTRLVKGKRTARMEPMFPSYLFVNVDLETFPATRLNSTRGLRHIIRFGGQWTTIPKELVFNLMCHEDSDELRSKLSKMPNCGDKVLIHDGPFQGLEAIYQEPDGDKRSILLLDMLQSEVRHACDNRSFSPIQP